MTSPRHTWRTVLTGIVTGGEYSPYVVLLIRMGNSQQLTLTGNIAQ